MGPVRPRQRIFSPLPFQALSLAPKLPKVKNGARKKALS
jgi:hypothetical protein